MSRADFSTARGASWSMLSYTPAPTPGLRGVVDRVRMRREHTRREQEMRRPVDPQELAEAIGAAQVPDVGPASLIEALVHTVDDAKPYQPPDGSEAVAADPVVRAALAPIASRVAESPFAGTWGAAEADQWVVAHADSYGMPDVQRDNGEVLAEWRQAIVKTEESARGTGVSGMWWSRPPHELSSSRSLWPDFGPVDLHLEEDGRDPEQATAIPVGRVPERTFEITGAGAWAHLCREYPLDLTHSLGSTWKQSMGLDAQWVIPDWSAVAVEWDAVHLTITGYLEAATRPLPVREGVASAIAGWNPDETVWLGSRPSATGEAIEWRRHQHLGWRIASGDADSL